MQEIWNDVVGYENKYQVSSLGKIRSFRHGKWHLMVPQLNWNGYYKVVLSKDGKKKPCRLHRLVLEAFNGPIPEGMEVNHINEVKTDNRVENLNLLTRKENINHGTCVERRAETLKKIYLKKKAVYGEKIVYLRLEDVAE